jgi:hypothetical protein
MECDDCKLETGRDGSHATDAECMEALFADRDRYKAALESLVKHARGCQCTACPEDPCPLKEAVELLKEGSDE